MCIKYCTCLCLFPDSIHFTVVRHMIIYFIPGQRCWHEILIILRDFRFQLFFVKRRQIGHFVSTFLPPVKRGGDIVVPKSLLEILNFFCFLLRNSRSKPSMGESSTKDGWGPYLIKTLTPRCLRNLCVNFDFEYLGDFEAKCYNTPGYGTRGPGRRSWMQQIHSRKNCYAVLLMYILHLLFLTVKMCWIIVCQVPDLCEGGCPESLQQVTAAEVTPRDPAQWEGESDADSSVGGKSAHWIRDLVAHWFRYVLAH